MFGLDRHAAFVQMLRSNVDIIVPNNGIAADTGIQEKRQAFQIGKNRLFQQRERIIKPGKAACFLELWLLIYAFS